MTYPEELNGKLSFGQKLADKVAGFMGSWTFIVLQSLFVLVWIGLNIIAWTYAWDPYPFILLNLLFSTQAAYAAPVIMMSQNRQADRDREQFRADRKVNREAKADIIKLQTFLNRIEKEKLDKIITLIDKGQI